MSLELPVCKIVGVFGPVASGKTHLIHEWVGTLNRFVLFDSTGEFTDGQDMTVIWMSPRQLVTALETTPYVFRIAYQPGPNLETDFSWCLKILWNHDTDKTLIVDEFHLLCPNNGAIPDVEYMLRFARHDRLGFIGVSQRLADVHKLFTSSCRMVVLFWTQEARDLDAISDRWGKDCASMVAALRPLVHDDISGVTTQIPQCVVCEKGKQPCVFDFANAEFLGSTETTDGGEEPEPDPVEAEDGEPLS